MKLPKRNPPRTKAEHEARRRKLKPQAEKNAAEREQQEPERKR